MKEKHDLFSQTTGTTKLKQIFEDQKFTIRKAITKNKLTYRTRHWLIKICKILTSFRERLPTTYSSDFLHNLNSDSTRLTFFFIAGWNASAKMSAQNELILMQNYTMRFHGTYRTKTIPSELRKHFQNWRILVKSRSTDSYTIHL